MNQQLAAAEVALKAGQGEAAIEHLAAALTADPAQTAQVYRSLVIQLYQAGRYAEGETWSAAATARFPKDALLWNVRGILLRKLKRYPDALAALDAAARIMPNDVGVLNNKGNVLLDNDEAARAEAVFAKLVRADPRNSEFQRMLGRSLARQSKRQQAISRFRQAVATKKDNIDAWLDLSGQYVEDHDPDGAEEVIARAMEANPGNEKLMETRVTILRRSGQLRRAEAYMTEMLPSMPRSAWLHYQLGGTISDYDRMRGNGHMRMAMALDPERLDYRMALIESLERTRTGDEGANIEEAYQLVSECIDRIDEFTSSHTKIVYEVLIRVCDFAMMDKVGDPGTLGRSWAETGKHTALLKLLAQVKTLEDRYDLLENHRIWGRMVEKIAKRHPLKRKPPRPKDGKIRLGLMSSDLRRHPVGYFALPLFEQVDPERFELYCYSYYQGAQADGIQEFITSKSVAYRWNSDITARNAAQMIADDQLDMLIELGGTTHMNKLDVMAYRPAPVQASWLGYPHSAGLETIDYLICDPYTAPPRRDLLVEEPLMMPKSWIALGRMVFSEDHVIEPGLPEDKAGRITFGTANNPHKYNPEMFRLWSEVIKAVPGSRFLFVRPEGGTATFRKNVLGEFEKNGVGADSVAFHTIRGAHMPVYNQMDISLDTMPLTGGTTTTESLWMGVPVVSLVGEAFFERLSASILINSNVGDLAADNPEEFVRIATALASDRNRRLEIRQNLREWMKAGPLGDTDQFGKDFYDLIERTVRARS